ncbi:hypothetical protein [uncultured Marivita sp.]|uniref:hypothetical protein n=1 Tax=uncultured Marivita sp. TaxID=888080 RepID=UPI00260D60A6|nr:hypothetical protein [uncultured Marivita sp.]
MAAHAARQHLPGLKNAGLGAMKISQNAHAGKYEHFVNKIKSSRPALHSPAKKHTLEEITQKDIPWPKTTA